MTKQNILVSAAVATLISLIVSFAFPNTVQTVVEKVNDKVQAVVSSELPTNYFSYGEVRRWAYRPKFNTATTTLCAVKSPAATSTLVSAAYIINTGTTTAATIDIAKGNTQGATTTLLVTATAVASGALANVSWTSAGATAADDIMAPNTWVLVKTAGAGLGGYTYGGNCSVVFQEF